MKKNPKLYASQLKIFREKGLSEIPYTTVERSCRLRAFLLCSTSLTIESGNKPEKKMICYVTIMISIGPFIVLVNVEVFFIDFRKILQIGS